MVGVLPPDHPPTNLKTFSCKVLFSLNNQATDRVTENEAAGAGMAPCGFTSSFAAKTLNQPGGTSVL